MTHVLMTEEAFQDLASIVTPPDDVVYVVGMGELSLIEGIGEVRSIAVTRIAAPDPSVPRDAACEDDICTCEDCYN